DWAVSRGFTTMVGRANPLTTTVAYAPIIQALGARLRGMSAADRFGLTADLPALARLFQELDVSARDFGFDASIERTWLFEAVVRLVDRLSRHAPAAMLLDDLQWLDHASIELIAYLSRELPGLPVAVLATWNPAEGSEHALPALISSLRRSDLLVEIELGPLDAKEVETLVESRLGKSPAPAAVRSLVATAGGVPLFVTALVRAAVESNAIAETGRGASEFDLEKILSGVAEDAITSQLDALDAEEAELVTLTAAGVEIEIEILLAACSTATRVHADELIRRSVLVEEPDSPGAVRLWHPLAQRAVYQNLSEPRRSDLHARLAEAYREVTPDAVLAMAAHITKAFDRLDPGWAVDVLQEAADQSMSRSAFTEAIQLLQTASSVARSARPTQVPGILMKLGACSWANSRIEDALSWWREALELVDRHDKQTVYRIQRDLAFALGEVAFEDSDRQIEVAMAAMPDDTPPEEALDLLYLAVSNAHRRGDLAAVESSARRLVEAAATVQGQRAAALAEAGNLSAALEQQDYRAVGEILGQGRMLRSGDSRLEMRHHMVKAHMAAVFGDLDGLREANHRAKDLLRTIRVPAWETRVYVGTFCEAFFSGDWEGARETVQEADLLAVGMDHALASLLAALLAVMLHSHRAEFEQASQSLRRAMDTVHEPVSMVTVSALFHTASSILALERGNPGEALYHIDSNKHLQIGTTLPPWDMVTGGMAHALMGQATVALTEAEALADLGEGPSYPNAMALRIRGHIHAGQDETGKALEALGQAAATFSQLGMPFEEARAGIEAMEIAHARPDDRMNHWLGTMRRVGAERYRARAERIAAQLGVHLSPAPTEVDLTPRQLELAELVAKGMSNAEIAEELFISIRTVHSHLDHIYTRLGIGSRAALATHVTSHRSSTQP
ncbi:MAG: LuxR C-terminal-related transcriptional regulator, partial [Acidimicrobiia bacterium]